MNTLQELIKEMEDDNLRAEKECRHYGEISQVEMCAKYIGYTEALRLYIPMLKLLLNAETQTTVKKPEA